MDRFFPHATKRCKARRRCHNSCQLNRLCPAETRQGLRDRMRLLIVVAAMSAPFAPPGMVVFFVWLAWKASRWKQAADRKPEHAAGLMDAHDI